MRKLI
ncbi:hypothetical protein CP8484711_1508A, partial [Chlamydia psittaci 84-8471/1]|jgi:hypothetical protein